MKQINETNLKSIVDNMKQLNKEDRLPFKLFDLYNEDWLMETFHDEVKEDFYTLRDNNPYEFEGWSDYYETDSIEEMTQLFCEEHPAIAHLVNRFSFRGLVGMALYGKGLEESKVEAFIEQYKHLI